MWNKRNCSSKNPYGVSWAMREAPNQQGIKPHHKASGLPPFQFGLLTDKALRCGVFTSVKELETTIHDFIAQHNGEPKPFVWTKSANKILEKVERARKALMRAV